MKLRPSLASVASVLALSVALGGGTTFAIAQSEPVAELTVPAGTVTAYAGATPPAGYLSADGSEVNRLQYPDLFAAVGTTYGAGNGTTTFNVPDLRGRVVVGRGTHADVDALTDSDGLAASARKTRHRHGAGSLSASGGSHDHSGNTALWNYRGDGGGSHNIGGCCGGGNAVAYGSAGGGGGHGHAFSGSVGDTSGPADAPAHQVLSYVIKH